MHSEPRKVVADKRRSSNDPKAILGEARDRQVSFHSAMRIKELCVCRASHLFVHITVGNSLEERQCALATHLYFSKGSQIKKSDPLAGGFMFLSNPFKIRRTVPAPLALIGTRPAPGFTRLEEVYAFPAELFSKDGPHLL